ncbi:MAG TPA: TIGR03067 domain-containing protein [Urbifossiella sp.]|nr:TIGR03067 domain-containing protein [Urbifossiella sp.]
MRASLGVVVAGVLVAAGGAAQPDATPKVEGRWKVVSVELAGAAVPGLDGAELVLADGKKVFTLPGGVVEKGTYRLDAGKQPVHIDVTTEGREGTEKGIVAVEGDVLKMCLATRGGPRPTKLATRKGTDEILIVLRRAGAEPAKQPPGKEPAVKPPSGVRNFRMGFTGFVYDITPEAVAASHKFCRENGDLLAHHIEGVPWAEAHSGQPFPKAFLDGWQGKKAATPPGGKVYLAVSPGRGDLKLAEKAGPLPAALKGKPYDDPAVMAAYLNYCRRAVEFFRPDTWPSASRRTRFTTPAARRGRPTPRSTSTFTPSSRRSTRGCRCSRRGRCTTCTSGAAPRWRAGRR